MTHHPTHPSRDAHPFLLHALEIALIVALTGCAGSPKVKYTYDHETDFSKLKTFTIAPNKQQILAPRMLNGQPLVQTVQQLIQETLVRRGFTPAGDASQAQLLVRWLGDIAYTNEVSHGSPGLVDPELTDTAYGMPPVGPSAAPSSSSSYLVTQGAITVDVVEPRTNHSIWRGTVTASTNANLPDPEVVKKLNEALEKLLANLPPPGK